jgi:hypothetical protein
MQMTLEPTEEFFMAGDVMVRLWTGTSSDGIPVIALVSGVAVAGHSLPLGEKLIPIPPPDHDAQVQWAESILARTPGNIGCD